MTSPLRKLLVVGALCWVAPLGAEQRQDAGQAAIAAESECPNARAARLEAEKGRAHAPLLGQRGPSAVLLP